MLLWEDLIAADYIAAHTEGFAELKAIVRDYTPAMVADICGVKAEDIATAARWFGQSKTALSLYCQGLNQSTHGTDNNIALIHLHLATGKIGKPGCGPFSLTGQPNAMGGREVGGMANLKFRDLDHSFDASLWWLLAIPFGVALCGTVLHSYSWILVARRGFSYDYQTGEASWLENGQRCVFVWDGSRDTHADGSH